ncbi:CIC11C00000001817 [Sungouiella intermedia]|uniref:CIC11C00000000801 n=1 Tax=Sungouiella intermedia TaxID=45354 RepID=A0A1L0BJE2_9ASCO|nr:CIC11C00000001817 [[Candida] intermedia]SGZ51607.1 CIC11C00000000801 [[Candida] intermedia]
MSDAGRKPFTDKVTEAVKPDSEKSILEKGSETVTDAVDNFAARNVPNLEKSFGQSIADNAKVGHDDAKAAVEKEHANAQQQGATLAETASEYLESAKEQVANAAEYVSLVVTGATEGAKTAANDSKK